MLGQPQSHAPATTEGRGEGEADCHWCEGTGIRHIVKNNLGQYDEIHQVSETKSCWICNGTGKVAEPSGSARGKVSKAGRVTNSGDDRHE